MFLASQQQLVASQLEDFAQQLEQTSLKTVAVLNEKVDLREVQRTLNVSSEDIAEKFRMLREEFILKVQNTGGGGTFTGSFGGSFGGGGETIVAPNKQLKKPSLLETPQQRRRGVEKKETPPLMRISSAQQPHDIDSKLSLAEFDNHVL